MTCGPLSLCFYKCVCVCCLSFYRRLAMLFFKYVPFVFHWEKKVTRLSKWWQSFHFGGKYEFNLLSFSVSTSVCMGHLSTETHQETRSCLAEETPFFPPPRNHFALSFSNRSPREASRLAELCPCLPGWGSTVLSQDAFHMLTDCSQSNQCVYLCAFTCVCVCVRTFKYFFLSSQ